MRGPKKKIHWSTWAYASGFVLMGAAVLLGSIFGK